MWDNLRDQASSSPFFQDDEFSSEFPPEASAASGISGVDPFSSPVDAFSFSEDIYSAETPRRFLGMTPQQRFVIALMLFFTVCLMGTMFLLVTGKIGFPMG